jgi:hypothetical protein
MHQILVDQPGLSIGLLVQVHAHHQRLTQTTGDFDELNPRWMVAQDVAHYQLAVALLGGLQHPLAALDSGRNRLFKEYVGSCLQSPDGEGLVRFWVGVNTDYIGMNGFQSQMEIGEQSKASAQAAVEGLAAGRAAADQANNLKYRDALIGAGMRTAHIPTADDQYPQGIVHIVSFDHFNNPDCLRGIVRESQLERLF